MRNMLFMMAMLATTGVAKAGDPNDQYMGMGYRSYTIAMASCEHKSRTNGDFEECFHAHRRYTNPEYYRDDPYAPQEQQQVQQEQPKKKKKAH